MKKYFIKKGTTVSLCRHAAFTNERFHEMKTERDLIYTEDEKYPEKVHDNYYYLYFKLPDNDRGYKTIAVRKSYVVIEE